MATEIERKFLVRNGSWRGRGQGEKYRQGYLCNEKERTVRIRIAGARAYLTVKGISTGAARAEFEYAIPYDDAAAMLERLCQKPLIEKTRYVIQEQGSTWEVDEFEGANQGLIIAEIELEREDQSFIKPDWIGDEVTGDARYYNASLVRSPYSLWR